MCCKGKGFFGGGIPWKIILHIWRLINIKNKIENRCYLFTCKLNWSKLFPQIELYFDYNYIF